MRLRIWNAYASNNSGSYVIVGRFPTAELATRVADELREVVKAETAWQDAPRDASSPLAVYAATHGVTHDASDYDDWPSCSQMAHPAVWTVGHQVFVHSDYTVTLPPALGHLMYAHGGRVEIEVNHAHEAIAAWFDVYLPWQTRKDIDVPARMRDIVDALRAEDGALTSLAMKQYEPAWRGGSARFGEADLVIGAAFEDLCAGFTAIARACAAAGAIVHVRVAETEHETDPFASLRPPRTIT